MQPANSWSFGVELTRQPGFVAAASGLDLIYVRVHQRQEVGGSQGRPARMAASFPGRRGRHINNVYQRLQASIQIVNFAVVHFVGWKLKWARKSRKSAKAWRRGWDSNPRCGYPYNGFREQAHHT